MTLDGDLRQGTVPNNVPMQIDWQCDERTSVADLEPLKKIVGAALDALSDEFQEDGGAALVSDVSLTIHVHRGGMSEARMTTNVVAGRPNATLQFLAPSCHHSSARTNVGEPKDRLYVHKTMVHELSMLFLWQVTRRKPGGWSFWDAPDWITDGWEEFLALTRSTDHARQVTHGLYLTEVSRRWTTGRPQRLDRYLDGAIILDFMHQRFGKQAMSNFLRSSEQKFAAALPAVLGCSEDGLLCEFESWVSMKAL